MRYDKPEAIICLLCKAGLVQKREWEGMQCCEAPQAAAVAHMLLPLLQSMLRFGTAPQFSCWTVRKLSHHYPSPLWELKNESPPKCIDFEIGEQLPTHFLWAHAIQELSKTFPYIVFGDTCIYTLQEDLCVSMGELHKSLWADFYSRSKKGLCFSQEHHSWNIWHISVCIYLNCRAALKMPE